MRATIRFVPSAESLEQLQLLAVVPANIATFFGPIALDGSDPSNHKAFGFPGMQFTAYVTLPTMVNGVSYSGLKQVTYDVGGVLSTDPKLTSYSGEKGIWGIVSSSVDTITQGIYNQQTDYNGFGCPKDAGTVTIKIDAQAWRAGANPPTAFDDLTDTLTIKVETPTISSFQVSDSSAAGVPASPFWFGTASGSPAIPDPKGSSIGFMMTGGTPPARSSVGFFANVTNTTHYALTMGYIQTAGDNLSYTYSDGTGNSLSFANGLDVGTNASNFYFKGYSIPIDPGATIAISGSSSKDSPSFIIPIQESNQRPPQLTQISDSPQFSTNLVVAGGVFPNQHGVNVAGFPVALSTAQWHFNGSASLNGNLQWTSSVGAGSGPTPAILPGPNVPWTSKGDGVSKYLTWTKTVPTITANFSPNSPPNYSNSAIPTVAADSVWNRNIFPIPPGIPADRAFDDALELLALNLPEPNDGSDLNSTDSWRGPSRRTRDERPL